MANIMNQKTRYLINRWAKRIAMVEKVQGHGLTFEKKAALANALEETRNRIKMVEATNPGSIGQYKRYALDIVNSIVPNLIAFDVMAVQSMDNRVGMINYISYDYSKSKGQTKAGDTFASSINMGISDRNYTSDLVDNEAITLDGAGKATLNWYPVLPGTFSVEIGGTVYIPDATTPGKFVDDQGNKINATVTPAGTLDLGSSNANATVAVTYRFNNEDIRSDGPVAAGFTNVPEIELNLKSLPVEAHARTLRAFWAFDAQYELQKEYGQDIETLLATQATGELAHEIDNELTFDLYNFADAGQELTWSRALTPGIALKDHYDSFGIKLTEGANKIFDATRKVKANFMICGLDVATVVENMRNFKGSGITAVGPHFLGTINDNIKVFVNPDYNSKVFVLGYKGNNMFDAGAFYCPYMPVSSTDLIMDANFRGQRGWATMYGKKMLNSKMYIKGRITD